MTEQNDNQPADTTPGAADPAEITVDVAALRQERDEYYDRLLRKSAEFDNFRKRVERERKEFTEWAAADVLGDLRR